MAHARIAIVKSAVARNRRQAPAIPLPLTPALSATQRDPFPEPRSRLVFFELSPGVRAAFQLRFAVTGGSYRRVGSTLCPLLKDGFDGSYDYSGCKKTP